MSKRRVVVTGLGMVSPLGLTVDETWRKIVDGQSGVRTVTRFDASDFSVRISAMIENFDATAYMSAKDARKNDSFIQYSLAATAEALQDSGITVTEDNAHRFGVAVGSGIGGIGFIEANNQALTTSGPRRVSPFFIPGGIINMASGQISIRHGLKGPNIAIVTACTTGTHNLGHAARMIAYGDADIMVAGGTENAGTPLCLAGFAACRALSTRNDEPAKASRPWDKDRDGFVLGEGAGIMILEEYEHAKKRGAKIHAELVGFGMSADAFHITAPDEQGIGFASTMNNALHDAGMQPDQIDYVNAHGTSTPVGDAIEAMAVKKVFADHAKQLAVSSTKSMTGHMLGAAGAVEAIFSVLAIRDQVAPPTINLDNPDEGCDLNFVANVVQQRKIDVVLSNSFGFGGTNGSLIFTRC